MIFSTISLIKSGKISSIWDDVPGEGHGDVLVAHQPIPIVPEVMYDGEEGVQETAGVVVARDACTDIVGEILEVM